MRLSNVILRDNEIAEGCPRRRGVGTEQPHDRAGGRVVAGQRARRRLLVVASGASSRRPLLAEARSIATAPLKTPPPARLPGQPAPPAPARAGRVRDGSGTARRRAQEVRGRGAAYPTSAGLEARLTPPACSARRAASRTPEAWRGSSASTPTALCGRMAKLGIATIQIDGKVDPAITTLTRWPQRADLEMPIDGVLMPAGARLRQGGQDRRRAPRLRGSARNFPIRPTLATPRRKPIA
jgi:hypothetical protein